MSRALTIFVILSALATVSALVLGLTAESLAWSSVWPDFTRAIAVTVSVVAALVWCTERICREMDKHTTALREAAAKSEKRTQKRLRAMETLTRERIEASRQVQDIFEGRRRANDR